ncbi:MAG: HAD family hydrolase [Myxococcales bacterium]|nr:HAD family hydrolase [Myxococcales bacterium]
MKRPQSVSQHRPTEQSEEAVHAAAIAAFFDVDLTLLRVSSGSQWISYLRRRGEVGLSMMLKAAFWTMQYKLAFLDMETVGRRLIADIEGDTEADMLQKCEAFLAHHILPHVAPDGRSAVAWHQAQGHVPVLLTSATQYVAEPLARELGVEHVLCTRLIVDPQSGAFTGTAERPMCYGEGKVVYAERFAQEQGCDLRQSYFYTDSYSDLPMLRRVGKPQVINPDSRLLRHAKKSGWPIARW